MYPYETLDNIPDDIWDIVDAFFKKAEDDYIEDMIELGRI